MYGEGIWTRSPTPEAMAPLSGREDEFVSLAELVDLAVENGFAPVVVQEASLEEWDAFESGFTARFASWLATHEPDHPDADEVRARAERQQRRLLPRLPRHPGPGLPAAARCVRVATIARVTSLRRLAPLVLVPLLALAAGCGGRR